MRWAERRRLAPSAIAGFLLLTLTAACSGLPFAKPLEQRHVIVAEKYQFIPSSLRVTAGDPVTLKLKSNDIAHGFELPAFGIRTVIPAGGEREVRFRPDKPGTYRFRNQLDCTPCRNMVGSLIVEEAEGR